MILNAFESPPRHVLVINGRRSSNEDASHEHEVTKLSLMQGSRAGVATVGSIVLRCKSTRRFGGRAYP